MLSSTTKKRIGYWLFLFIFLLLALEVLLRIFNPFPSSVVGNKIILTPNYNKIYKNNTGAPNMDGTIVYKRNSIGLRGPEPPGSLKDHLSIIAVGGSTTECMFISEGKTWEDQLQQNLSKSFPTIWINNAGFAGHSTFGHIILLRDYIVSLKPSICLFLIGGNDIDRTDLQPHDEEFSKTKEKWILTLAKKSALVNTSLNLYRNHLAKEKNITDGKAFTLFNKKPLFIPDSIIEKKLKQQQPLLSAYGERVNQLIKICKEHSIEPILVTQPCLIGDKVDSVTGVNLSTFPMSEEINGKLFSSYMDLYNTETARVAAKENVLLIDLAKQLSKNSIYYYDVIHYNNIGNKKVGEIIATHLLPYLRIKYPQLASDD